MEPAPSPDYYPPSPRNFTSPPSPWNFTTPPPPPLAPSTLPTDLSPSSLSQPGSSFPSPLPYQMSPSPNNSVGRTVGIVVGLVASVLVVVLLVISILFILYRRSKNKSDGRQRPHQDGGGDAFKLDDANNFPSQASPPAQWRPLLKSGSSTVPTTNSSSRNYTSSLSGSTRNDAHAVRIPIGSSKNEFTYEDLAQATDGFCDANYLGEGGFGYVHKGILPNGNEVVVKQLKAGGSQGNREFQAEVEIIKRAYHRHIVSLVGYCITSTHRLLVYEFVSNKTLAFHLHENKGSAALDWAKRMRIALGAAKGLAYLHEECHPAIIHRDIKADNILLDDKLEAKVADFGLAKFFTDINTHVSSRMMGTLGYLDPEYDLSGKLTEKSDVFSFGIVLLELITGRRQRDSPSQDCSLVEWAKTWLPRALKDKNFQSIADPKLRNVYEDSEMSRMVECAAASIQDSAKHRPRMSKIVRTLEGEEALVDLNVGIRARQSTVYSDYDMTQHKNGKLGGGVVNQYGTSSPESSYLPVPDNKGDRNESYIYN